MTTTPRRAEITLDELLMRTLLEFRWWQILDLQAEDLELLEPEPKPNEPEDEWERRIEHAVQEEALLVDALGRGVRVQTDRADWFRSGVLTDLDTWQLHPKDHQRVRIALTHWRLRRTPKP